MNSGEEAKRYAKTCQEDFWQKIFRAETDYLMARLEGCRDILSVGCGPAIIEGELIRKGFHLTGLDVSAEALACAPDGLRTVTGRAEDMPFPDNSFDAVIFVASLQFIADYRSALTRTFAVLRPERIFLAMLLNPESLFFKKMKNEPDAYVRFLRHQDLREIAEEAARHFVLQTEYALGIRGENVFESDNPSDAALYVLVGRKAKQRQGLQGKI
ncbi:MAG: class I SAM-dependent methyltransferase [Smithella sp.]|nr:class I SAM-dependent methyltransferase [Smithella sp.]